jgi:hypothetical protein
MMAAMGGICRLALALGIAVAFTGCDSRAKASDPAGGRAEAKSKEYESCGASVHCQDDLRCLENVCRRSVRSAVGDYYAALGIQLRTRGELTGAIEAFNKALAQYDNERIALPPDIDCAYGTTLVQSRSKKEHAELAARVLHRCVLAVPPGGSLHERALADVAQLTEAGLEPLTLGRTQLADVYLTRVPQRPPTEKLAVRVTATPAVAKKTFALIPEALAQPDLKPALVACWEAYNQATRKDALTVTLAIQSKYYPSQYDDEPGRYQTKIDPAAGTPAGPEANAEQCVRAAVEPVLTSLTGIRDSFQTRLTISVK